MPGAVPHTSTYALTNVTLPYAVELADHGWRDALRRDHPLALGLNTYAGAVTYGPVAQAHGLDAVTLEEVLAEPGPRGRCRPLDRSVQGWLDHLQVERGASVNTLSSYRRDLARYREFLAGRGVTDAGAGHRARRHRASSRRCARAATGVRPSLRRRPPARSSRYAASTGSWPWRAR